MIHNLEVENEPPTNDRSPTAHTSNRASVSRLEAPRKTWNAQRLSIASEAFMGHVRSTGSTGNTGETLQDTEEVGLTTWEAAANFVIGLIGAGVLVLPKNLANVGGFSGMFCLSLAFLCACECALQIVYACAQAESLSGGTSKVAGYEDLAGEAIGASGRVLLVLVKNIYFLCVLVVYGLFVIDGIDQLLPPGPQFARWFIVYPIFVLGVLVKDLKQIAPLQQIAIAAAFVQCGTLVLGSLAEMTHERSELHRPLVTGNMYDFGQTMAKSIFACGGVASMAPAVRSQMAYPEQCPKAVRAGMAIVFVIYSSVVLSGYIAYGTNMENNILVTINKNCRMFQCILGQTTAIAINLKLCFTVPPFFLLIINVFEAMGNRSVCKPLSIPNLAFRVSLMTLLFVIGMLVPHVGEVIGLISASFGINLALIFPLVICYALKKKLLQSPVPRAAVANNDVRDYVIHSFIALMSLMVAYFGIAGAIGALKEKLNM